jgi:hypothetical protein
MATRWATGLLCLALLTAAGSGAGQRDVQLVRVVDTQTRIPGQGGLFTGFSAPVIDGDWIAFYAHGLSLEQGIYLYGGGRLTTLVDQNSTIPGEQDPFAVLSDPELHDGSVAFSAHGAATRVGIYLVVAGRLGPLVRTGDPVRGVYGSFSRLDPPALHAGGVAFRGSDGNLRQGIYTRLDGAVGCVASQDTPIPDGDGLFGSFDGPDLHAGRVAFRATSGRDQQGIYSDLGGELRAIVDTTTPIPNGRGQFEGFGHPPTIEGEAIAFLGQGPDQQRGIYLWRDGVLSMVADNSTPIPGGSGTFSSYSAPSLAGDAIAFRGLGLSGQSGIYLWSDGAIVKVVDLTDRPDEKTPVTLELRPGGLSSRRVVFVVSFSDGTEAVYRATVP